MAWQRGARVEYDSWGSTFGNGEEWSWDGLLPYFRRVETWTPPPTGDDALMPDANPIPSVHGSGGPIAASHNSYYTDLDRPLIEASTILGFPLNDDPEGGNTTFLPRSGITHTVNPISGTRSYAASYYGGDVRSRKNLAILTNAMVTRIIWDESTLGTNTIRANGVEFVAGNQTYTVKAAKEVILSAGMVSVQLHCIVSHGYF